MAIRHRHLPIAAVQFHPESILSLGLEVGHAIIGNVVGELTPLRASPAIEAVTA